MAELERYQLNWQRAMRDRDYASVHATYLRWEEALTRVGDAVREEPGYLENLDAFERAAPVHRRIDEHRTLAKRVDEMKALRQEINVVLARAHQIATALPDSDNLERELSELDQAIRDLVELRRRGREFERYQPFQEFSSDVQRAKVWLYKRKRRAEWAREVSEALSVVITRGGVAAKSAMDTQDRRARRQRLHAAARHFKNCITIGHKASQAGSYADDYPLDTPVGHAPLGKVVEICRQAVARATKVRRGRRS